MQNIEAQMLKEMKVDFIYSIGKYNHKSFKMKVACNFTLNELACYCWFKDRITYCFSRKK